MNVGRLPRKKHWNVAYLEKKKGCSPNNLNEREGTQQDGMDGQARMGKQQ